MHVDNDGSTSVDYVRNDNRYNNTKIKSQIPCFLLERNQFSNLDAIECQLNCLPVCVFIIVIKIILYR